MTRTVKGTLHIAMAALAIAFGADALSAEDGAPREIRVLNSHGTPVEVYVEDAKGRSHFLGEVDEAELKFIELDEDIPALGAFRIKVFPKAPANSITGLTRGIKSVDLELVDGQAVNVWLGTDLAKSQIEVTG